MLLLGLNYLYFTFIFKIVQKDLYIYIYIYIYIYSMCMRKVRERLLSSKFKMHIGAKRKKEQERKE